MQWSSNGLTPRTLSKICVPTQLMWERKRRDKCGSMITHRMCVSGPKSVKIKLWRRRKRLDVG